jgi:hypothetical protein
MKTGTTSLQLAARGRRDILLANGVRYPGTEVNHRRSLAALMGWSVNIWARAKPLQPDRLDIAKSGVPPRKDWDDLKAEIEADEERRIFITHEFVSQVDDETARQIVEEIGERIHVCLTLRPPGEIVPSLWAQSIRDDAQTEPMNEWLARFYGQDPDHPIPARFQRAYDQARLVERWTRLVGPDRVTVVIADKSNPELLTGAFETMLGLPSETLSWGPRNKSLTAVDAELFRHVNAILRDRGASWSTFHGLVRYGAIRLGPERRHVSRDEPRVVLPPWAAEIADQDGRRFADRIRRSQVRIVGDLDNLAVETRSAPWRPIDNVAIGVAAQAVSGAILAGQEARGSLKKEIESQSAEITTLKAEVARLATESLYKRACEIAPDQRAEQLASAFSTREMVAGVKRRLLHKLRTGRSRPLGRVKVSERPQATDRRE